MRVEACLSRAPRRLLPASALAPCPRGGVRRPLHFASGATHDRRARRIRALRGKTDVCFAVCFAVFFASRSKIVVTSSLPLCHYASFVVCVRASRRCRSTCRWTFATRRRARSGWRSRSASRSSRRTVPRSRAKTSRNGRTRSRPRGGAPAVSEEGALSAFVCNVPRLVRERDGHAALMMRRERKPKQRDFYDGELRNENPPTPCLWRAHWPAPRSTRKTKRKTRPAIR